ncbi:MULTISPECIES: hypothetical protein [spotted fever group]|uniref:Uncharacterized protein n=1 Tax=Rickettsia philipii (strain 364D) TaxID=481009 RepID=H6PTT2_RICP3|nr:hypothetical protein [Rickettsia philipii]AFB26279.1 hypothetical protein RSA_03570 [Rickettsia philipii str. 364D]
MSQLPLAVEFENSANEIAGESELMVSLEVNYTETDILPTIVQNAQGHYLIPLEDIEHFDVQANYLKQGLVHYHDTAYINLDLLEGTKYDLNFENLDLNITFPAEKFNLNHLMLQVVL